MKKLIIASVMALFAITASALEVGITTGVNFKQSDPYSFGGGCGFITGPSTCNRGADRNDIGLTVGHQIGRFALTAGYSRSTGGYPISVSSDGPLPDIKQDRYSLTTSFDLANVRGVLIVAKVGGAILVTDPVGRRYSVIQNTYGHTGIAATAGLGVDIPIMKQVYLTGDFTRQVGQSSVKVFDGNRVTAGLKYTF